MSELVPIPFVDLLRRMKREAESSQAIFDLPVRKWWIPGADEPDYSALHFGRRASTPVGPAAGPHTQLAQNLVLSWLAGSRILELKTVQINDRLDIPRPCIHAPNIGFNVEWSQELRIGQSIEEYAKGVFLIEILKHSRAFGLLPEGLESRFDTIYDISVGYDLEGIRSEPVSAFLDALRHPQEAFDHLRAQLPDDLAEYRDLELPDRISDCITLSTFHGCPADQIEAIARHLLEEKGLHTLIKLNPTLLGFERVKDLVHETLGYGHLDLRREAFEHDLQYEDGLDILRRLKAVAEAQGSIIGAKFTNTLVVANDPAAFPTQSDAYMYVSGAPLHVLAMTLMQQFRSDLATGPDGFDMPVSFSAGIDSRNFASAVACGMVPVTTCTDLLKAGGYGRLPAYLRSLKKAMKACGASSRAAYVLACQAHGAEAVRTAVDGAHGQGTCEQLGWGKERLAGLGADDLVAAVKELAVALGDDPEDTLIEDAFIEDALIGATRVAGRLNGEQIVAGLPDDTRYHAARNSKAPKRVDLQLELYDCINCDLCITACPNDAVFAYRAEPTERATEIWAVGSGGGVETAASGLGFKVAESHQLAILDGACNECSNCEVYCPEHGAPFQLKERVFHDLATFDSSAADGFCFHDGALHGRLGGRRMRLRKGGGRAELSGEGFHFKLDWESLELISAHSEGQWLPLDTALIQRFKTVWQGIFFGPGANGVSVQTSSEAGGQAGR